MTVAIDSCVIIALLNKRDNNHDPAKRLLYTLKTPKYGMRVTIDYVLNEVLTTLWMHTHEKRIVHKAYDLICKTREFIRFEPVSLSVLNHAWKKWKQLASWPKKPLSFADCCLLAFMEKNNIPYLATFGSDFDGLVTIVQ